MKKTNWDNLKIKITKEDIHKYYIEENHSQEESIKYFKISSYAWNKLIHIYKEFKPKHKKEEKIKNTNQIKYGVNYVSQNDIILNKIKNTKNAKTPKEKELIKEKIKKTNIKKYGVSTYSQLNECKEKVKNTNLKKYGVDNISRSPTYLKKKEATCLKRYGDKHYTNKKSANITIKNRYGVDNFGALCQLDEIKEKKKLKIKEKYGVNYFTESLFDNYSEIYKTLYHNKEKSIYYLKTNLKHTFKEWSEIFKCPLYSIFNWVSHFHLWSYIKNTKSHYEEDLINIISNMIPNDTIIHNDRKVLDNKQEIDIYIPKYKLGIEFNGTYWHSNLFLDRNYHFNKSKLAESKGIKLIHIWEYEWNNPKQQTKIITLLKENLNIMSNIIYARKCIIKQITNQEAKFLNENTHLQGHRGAQITYGLFYQNKLVQLMSFSKTKYNRNLKEDNSWEIIRECSGSNIEVVGGLSKLFKHFIKDYKPSIVFSYCDFNKFNGKGYNKLGMKFIGYTGPDMKWILKNGNVINRNPNKHKEIKSLSMAQIYGAGSKKYIWKEVTCNE